MFDMMAEMLERNYGFSDARIGEFRSMALAGKVKLVICADSLDEAPAELQVANLFRSNRLYDWGAPESGWPKLIISCRVSHFPQDRGILEQRFLASELHETQRLRIFCISLCSEARLKDYCASRFEWHVRKLLSGVCGIEEELSPIDAGRVTYLDRAGEADKDKVPDRRLLAYLDGYHPDGLPESSPWAIMYKNEYAAVLQRFIAAHPDASVGDVLEPIRQADLWTATRYWKTFNTLSQELRNTVFMIELLTEVLPKVFHPVRQARNFKKRLANEFPQDSAFVQRCLNVSDALYNPAAAPAARAEARVIGSNRRSATQKGAPRRASVHDAKTTSATAVVPRGTSPKEGASPRRAGEPVRGGASEEAQLAELFLEDLGHSNVFELNWSRSKYPGASVNMVTRHLRDALIRCCRMQPSRSEIYEEWVLMFIRNSPARRAGGADLQGVVLAWCEELSVEMKALNLSRINYAGNSKLSHLFSDDKEWILRAAPLLLAAGNATWLHQTVGSFFAARQCFTLLDQLTFLHHESLIRALITFGTEKLRHAFERRNPDLQRQESMTATVDDDDTVSRDNGSVAKRPNAQLSLVDGSEGRPRATVGRDTKAERDKAFRWWLEETGQDLLTVLEDAKFRMAIIKILRSHAQDGLFKASEASDAIEDLFRQLLLVKRLGFNRYDVSRDKELNKFLVDGVVDKPQRRLALISIVRLGNYSQAFSRIATGALHILDSVYLEVPGIEAPLNRTKLHVLAQRCKKRDASGVRKMLLEHGCELPAVEGIWADYNFSDERGMRPLDDAIIASLPSLAFVRVLVSGGAELSATRETAWGFLQQSEVWLDNASAAEAIALLARAGADCNVLNEQGLSILHEAILLARGPLVKALLATATDESIKQPEFKCDPNRKSSLDRRPLDLAHDTDTIELLCEYGAVYEKRSLKYYIYLVLTPAPVATGHLSHNIMSNRLLEDIKKRCLHLGVDLPSAAIDGDEEEAAPAAAPNLMGTIQQMAGSAKNIVSLSQMGDGLSTVPWVKMYNPVLLSNGDARVVRTDLRLGKLNTLIWCAIGGEWSTGMSPEPLTLNSIIHVVDELMGSGRPIPNLAVVCMKYGARKVAKALFNGGNRIKRVLWLRCEVSESTPAVLINVLLELLLPLVSRINPTRQTAMTAEDVEFFVRDALQGRGLLPVANTSYAANDGEVLHYVADNESLEDSPNRLPGLREVGLFSQHKKIDLWEPPSRSLSRTNSFSVDSDSLASLEHALGKHVHTVMPTMTTNNLLNREHMLRAELTDLSVSAADLRYVEEMKQSTAVKLLVRTQVGIVQDGDMVVIEGNRLTHGKSGLTFKLDGVAASVAASTEEVRVTLRGISGSTGERIDLARHAIPAAAGTLLNMSDARRCRAAALEMCKSYLLPIENGYDHIYWISTMPDLRVVMREKLPEVGAPAMPPPHAYACPRATWMNDHPMLNL